MSRPALGFSLVDVIVGTALLLLVFLSLLGVLRTSLVLSSVTKAKEAAIEVANAQMEYLRGLTYASLGTVGGIPAGAIPQYTTSVVDGVTYVTRSYIQYQDDPADGTGAADTNGVTTDYKVAKVTVSYTLYSVPRSVTIVSNFVPPGIESSTGGGTLSLHIVNAAGANVGNAVVQIVNASTSPTVNLATYSDSSGLVLLGGAATSSQYQIAVSKSGYSSAQTYPRTGQNVNPTPGYLTVTQNVTTGATFAIDLLSTLTLSSFTSATTSIFNDTFTSASNLTNQTGTIVAGGALSLAPEIFSGSARSTAIAPSYLDGWGILNATLSQPSGSTATVRVGDGSGTPIPDAALPGNGAGFSTFPVSLTALATSTYPSVTLEADLTRASTSTTVSILDWSLSHTEGPTPAPGIAFTLTGAKTIGTTGGGQSIYKTTVNDTTDAGGNKTETLEWDGYTLGLPGTGLMESCPSSPYSAFPAQATTTSIIVGTLGTNTLPLAIEDSAGVDVPQALVVLTKAGYAATIPASRCGIAYFNDIPSGTYTATVSAVGHTTRVFPNIVVAGHSATTTLTLP